MVRAWVKKSVHRIWGDFAHGKVTKVGAGLLRTPSVELNSLRCSNLVVRTTGFQFDHPLVKEDRHGNPTWVRCELGCVLHFLPEFTKSFEGFPLGPPGSSEIPPLRRAGVVRVLCPNSQLGLPLPTVQLED